MKLNFQTVLLAIFGIAVVVAVGIFATHKGTSKGKDGAVKFTVWSEFPPESGPAKAFGDFNLRNSTTMNVNYIYKDPATFKQEFITENSIPGSTNIPDFIIVPNDELLGLQPWLTPIADAEFSPQQFQQGFIAGASSLRTAGGTLAFPMMADPLVLYAHEDLMTNASLITTPKYWDELPGLQDKLTIRDQNNFTQSMIALGSYGNVTHGKDVLATMFLQAGIPIVARESSGLPSVQLSSVTQTSGEQPSAAIIRFWSDFANAAKTVYSWNSLQQPSIDAFDAEKLVFYPGLASDRNAIIKKNPHLKFTAAQIPQIRGQRAEVTGGRVWGIALVTKGKQKQAAKQALFQIVVDTQLIKDWSATSGLPPALLALLKTKPADPFLSTFWDAALRMRTWLDPNPQLTDATFKDGIEGISSGKYLPSTAVTSIGSSLQSEISNPR